MLTKSVYVPGTDRLFENKLFFKQPIALLPLQQTLRFGVRDIFSVNFQR
jgi:hypothetical protein